MAKHGQYDNSLMGGEAGKDLSLPAFAVKMVDTEKRQIRVLASSSDLDRHGDRVLPTAFKKHLHLFKQNPVILAGHLHRSDDASPTVVGKAISVWVDSKGLWAVIEFATTPLAEQYWQLYKGGFMCAVSVGFRVLDFRTEHENGKSVTVITEAELFEISLVAVPANPSAVVKSKDRKKLFIASIKQRNATVKSCKDFMREQGYPQEQIDYCFSEKHSIDFAKAFHDIKDFDEDTEVRSAPTGIPFDVNRALLDVDDFSDNELGSVPTKSLSVTSRKIDFGRHF